LQRLKAALPPAFVLYYLAFFIKPTSCTTTFQMRLYLYHQTTAQSITINKLHYWHSPAKTSKSRSSLQAIVGMGIVFIYGKKEFVIF